MIICFVLVLDCYLLYYGFFYVCGLVFFYCYIIFECCLLSVLYSLIYFFNFRCIEIYFLFGRYYFRYRLREIKYEGWKRVVRDRFIILFFIYTVLRNIKG